MAGEALVPETLTCPKCTARMLIHRYPENDAYRCEGCRGLWMPLMASEQLEERADEIDPEEYRGPSGPEPRRLMCPSCEYVPLIRMVHVELPDLHFESCKECYGRYYDAGEYREAMGEHSLLERLFGRD